MRVLWISAAIAFLLDQASKIYVLDVLQLDYGQPVDVFPPFLRFVMAWNRGVNFGIGASDADMMRWLLIALAIAISVGIVIWARGREGLWFMLGAGLVVGGALGNVLDRIRFGAVADFLNMSCCGIQNPFSFNIADAAIFAGAALLIIFSGDKAHKDVG